MNDFILGSRYAMLGFKDMLKPGIKRYVYIPLFINFLVFGAIFYVGVQYILTKLDFQLLHDLPKWLEWLNWLVSTIKFFLIGATITLLLAVCATLSTIFANLFGAPFNGLLSEVISRLHGKSVPSRSLIKSVGSAVSRESLKYLYIIPRALGVGILATILFFIPGLNLALPILFYWFSAFMMSIEYIDYPADNMNLPFKEMIKVRTQRRWLHLGFGLTVALLSSIPILNLLVMPAAVVGATRLWVENHAL